MAKWVADNEEEKTFEQVFAKHGEKLKALWEEVKKLSDETGLPVGPYTPEKYNDEFAWAVEPEFVKALTGATGDIWYHSSANC